MVAKKTNLQEDLKPKDLPNKAQEGMRTFTVYRQSDETGVSGTGIVIEGVVFATGECVVHWLTPPPSGSLAIWSSFDAFIRIHIKPHPGNKTIITFGDGSGLRFNADGAEERLT